VFEVIFFSLIVVAGTMGELCISRAMKETGEVHEFHPRAIAQAVFRAMQVKWTWIGIALMAVGFFSLLAILSVDNVSYVVPVTALSYVAGAFGGIFFLGERVNSRRWLGIALVCVGVTLVIIGNR